MSKKSTLLIVVLIASLILNVFQGYKLHGCHVGVGESKKNSHLDVQMIKSMEGVVPLVVIGSGPAGLSAAMRGARAGYDTLILQGAPSLLAQTEYVDNWLGSPHELGTSILERSLQQVLSFGARLKEAFVEKIDFDHWPYAIHLDDDTIVRALSMVISTGAHPRMLGIPGEKEYWGRGVSACARCDAPFYQDKEHVVVIGGGDSAIQEALELAPYAKSISIIHRRNQLRASSHSKSLLKTYPSIQIMYNTQPERIVGDESFVNGIEVVDTQTGKRRTIPVDGVFLAIGHIPNTKLFEGSLKLDDQGYIVVQKDAQTSKEGVFAAGDVADPVYRQADVAIGTGAIAGIEAVKFLTEIGFQAGSRK